MAGSIWTEEMWDWVAEETFTLMMTRPRKPLMKNAELAQKNLIEQGKIEDGNIRKTFQPDQMKPLYIRLERKLWAIQKLEAEVEELKAKVESIGSVPTEEEFLDTLPLHIIMQRFSKIVLDNVTPEDVVGSFQPNEILGSVPLDYLCGFAVSAYVRAQDNRELKVKHVVETHEIGLNGKHVNGQVKRLPKVACVGFKPNQFTRVVDHYAGVCECVLVDKMRMEKGLPTSVDGWVIWSNFTTTAQKQIIKEHCKSIGLGPDRRLELFGGFKVALEGIEQFVRN